MCAQPINNSFVKPQMKILCDVFGFSEFNGSTLSDTVFD